MTMNRRRSWHAALLGVLGAFALPARSELIKPVETIGSAGVIRLGTYLEDNVAYYVLPTIPFSFYGTNYSGLTVAVNGVLTFGNTGYITSNPSNLGMPRGSVPGLWICQDDWIQPEFGASPNGYMYYKQYSDGLAITWVNLRQAPVTLGTFTNTFQIFLFNNGDVAYGYDQLNRVNNYVVGINKGAGGVYSSLTGVNTGTTAFAETGVPSVNHQTYLFRYDGTNYQPSPAYTLSGTLTLEGIVAAAPAQTITLTFHPTDNSGDFSRTVPIDSTGAFSLPVLPAKTYTVRIKGAKWLAKSKALNLASGTVMAWNETLLAGDANNDNAADIGDLLILINAYNKVSSDPAYKENADFNSDGANDIGDLLLLIGNYNKLGD